ncbi:unnamed protein product [Dibothriocephalus latus]|uniref:Uncharacterized protein n=1 Tax=Dibothriocephalus latus TaxID=60516 RepID=A0A3P7LGY3_DIBLA|nr:unnamed protein product [Dibothriocephalus latus]
MAVIMPDLTDLNDVTDGTSPRVTISGWESGMLHPFSSLATEAEHRRYKNCFHVLTGQVLSCLDELRPRCPLVNPSGVVDIEKLWQLYWNILVVSAPIHQLLTTSFRDSADSSPNEFSSHQALLSILKLAHTWGPSLDVERSLWLYFSRKLDSTMDPDRDLFDSESYAAKIRAITQPEVHA